MIEILDKKKCSGCTACFNSCPTHAIKMVDDDEGFSYPLISKKDCINCHKCENVCPVLNHRAKNTDLKKCFAAFNKNNYERSISSSGGMFIALAKKVLQEGGVVYGSALNQNNMAYHCKATNEKELIPLVGSKYMQSILADTFTRVKTDLDSNIRVLFCGNACQVAGLKSYLNKYYENLICLDFICLGVPSPKIWKEYLLTYFNNFKLENVNFKDKSNGWHHFSLKIDKIGSKPFIKIGAKTYFFAGYFKGLFSRPVCHVCPFQTDENRISDITISDCWGFDKIAPEMDDNKGLSSIICHSQKGLNLFESIKTNIVWKDANIEDVKKYNRGYCAPRKAGENREIFWNDFSKYPAKKVFEKYCKPKSGNIISRTIDKIKGILHSTLIIKK